MARDTYENTTDKPKKEKKPISQKIYFGLFIILTVLAAFLFWATSSAMQGGAIDPDAIEEGAEVVAEGGRDGALLLVSAIITLCLALFFGGICFVRWLRRKSVSGGLFLTTALSTAVFLGTSHFLGALLPPMAAAFAIDPAATGAGLGVVLIIAQIGLFAMWFGFLMLTIYVYVSPIKRVDKYLDRILDGERVRKVRIGKSKQYKSIECKLKQLSERVRDE